MRRPTADELVRQLYDASLSWNYTRPGPTGGELYQTNRLETPSRYRGDPSPGGPWGTIYGDTEGMNANSELCVLYIAIGAN